MAFNKVVKAPTKLAHIRNCPHKKSEATQRRVKWLWEYAKPLVASLFVFKGDGKLFYYTQLSVVKKELKELGFYDEQAMRCIISQARWEHKRFHRW
ncbi:hypothetical protein KPP_12111 [Klebsiella phage KPP-1]|nr:hypothetical protein KPP_12111 [Klebsiella phage KPP-1]UVX29488.1 hypothetical protein M5b_00236 [Klebsiella phage VLCpiM5b]